MIDKHTLSRNGIYSEVALMDNMEYMAQFPDKFFDLAVVDPPYGIGAGKMTMGSGRHSFTKDKIWDNKLPDKKYFDELFRVSNNQIIWGGNYFTDFLDPTSHWLLWDKNNPNLSFAEGELAWVRHGNNLRIFKYYSAVVKGGKIHPTQKPIALYKWIYSKYAKPGMKIIDTHLGSGSNRIAAYDMGMNFWSCENDPDYFRDSVKWFDEYSAQGNLFDI